MYVCMYVSVYVYMYVDVDCIYSYATIPFFNYVRFKIIKHFTLLCCLYRKQSTSNQISLFLNFLVDFYQCFFRKRHKHFFGEQMKKFS